MLSSDRAAFFEAAANGANYIPLAHSWPADLETPLTTWLKVGAENPPGVLLESVEGGENLGRWSVVACDPLWTASCRGDRLVRRWREGQTDEAIGNPFEALRQWLAPYRTASLPDLPPLGQLYGMWSFELIQWVEPTVPVHGRENDDPPDGIWMLMDSILIIDQVKRLITAVAYADLTEEQTAEEAWLKAKGRIEDLEKRMSAPLAATPPLRWQQKGQSPPATTSNYSQIGFEDAVKTAKQHIAAGDVFQLVISQKLETKVSQQPLELYRSLRMVNPSPYMAFFDFGDWQLIGSSPEVMVKAEPVVDGIKASLRPIAGTRPRGSNELEDHKLEADLMADPKERAEHVMLVDLGRNDLGRVCRPGSVEVKELMVIEKYSHVMHIVSAVEGLLAEGKDVWDLLMASFPAGTVSGAPKIRAMQLINELEPDARGPYSGVYGAVDLNGALNTAITIRTMIVRPHPEGGWQVKVQAGAGVVADSVPTAEYEETLNKARGMLTALACLEPCKP
ncbi:MAG: anthranilate synthase component I family protein [Prochlorococcus sp.]|jgi:anthranilate synthase component 1|nr:chorismate-binding protein [Prochlorococcaceae cyanobacterium ETNP18_MAG_14]MDP6310302.1 chorismate-binding protein [Prochlorococcaceae cyanobacterium ETNP14_MAG_4]HJM80386.1 chorismate-binding protein [Prochlorococcaceae cyanobacterium Fu_MAG_72]|tara:strand:+ start:452 stop:1972 length:1521 start_codon:yes stop_codon:yes gene_type:complete